MKLREYRELFGLSQKEFAKAANVSGMAISRYESGRIPSSSAMRRIIEVTDGAVTANDFFDIPQEAAE